MKSNKSKLIQTSKHKYDCLYVKILFVSIFVCITNIFSLYIIF